MSFQVNRSFEYQASVIWELDNTIYLIHRYLVDKCWQNKPCHPRVSLPILAGAKLILTGGQKFWNRSSLSEKCSARWQWQIGEGLREQNETTPLPFSPRSGFTTGWSNQVGRVILTARKFAWRLALNEASCYPLDSDLCSG